MILTHEDRNNILYACFPETLSINDFYSLPTEFDVIEKDYSVMPNRLVNLSKVKSFNVAFSAILYLADERNKKAFPNRFKTALLVCNNYQLGFARMYQTFIENPQMTIEIFMDETKAIEWLKSDDAA